MTTSRDTYHAMMLRLWRDEHADQWRASIQDPHTGEKRRFTSIEQFCAYLHRKLAPPDDKPSQTADNKEKDGGRS